MEESSMVRLDLRAPLFYTEAPGLEAFAYNALTGGEELFCFELDPVQSLNIEPLHSCFPGRLIFAGRSALNGILRLPAGQYLFSQRGQALGREDCVDLAVEQQKDGLWQRLRPENRLYVRYLYEDGKPVTQLFRPYFK